MEAFLTSLLVFIRSFSTLVVFSVCSGQFRIRVPSSYHLRTWYFGNETSFDVYFWRDVLYANRFWLSLFSKYPHHPVDVRVTISFPRRPLTLPQKKGERFSWTFSLTCHPCISCLRSNPCDSPRGLVVMVPMCRKYLASLQKGAAFFTSPPFHFPYPPYRSSFFCTTFFSGLLFNSPS